MSQSMNHAFDSGDESERSVDENFAGEDVGQSNGEGNNLEPSSYRPEKRLKYRDRGHNNRMNKKKRRLLESEGIVEVPDSFDGHDLAKILTFLANPSIPAAAPLSNSPESAFPQKYHQVFPLTCALLIKTRSGLNRLYRKSVYKFPRSSTQQPEQFYQLIRFMVQPGPHNLDRLLSNFTVQNLLPLAEELASKSVNLNNDLQKEFLRFPLYPLHPVTNLLQFPKEYLSRVEEYHASLQRPEGTFDLPEDQLEKLKQLAELPRHECPLCHGFRQIYCGPCGGVVLEESKAFLPPPIELPFEVLLLLHYQESLVKCTGIHASALCQANTLTYLDWEKPAEKWQSVVESLDPERDIILFPYQNSIPAESFPWTDPPNYLQNLEGASENNNTTLPLTRKYRLVVLEASWGYGKTMAQQILDHRRAKNLPPIRSVILTNITGEYWRFQAEGHSAVSTIEAIAHTAKAAGVRNKTVEDLLTLFRLQKYRVLKNTTEGGKIPRAVEVAGVGLGSWKNVSALDDDSHEN